VACEVVGTGDNRDFCCKRCIQYTNDQGCIGLFVR